MTPTAKIRRRAAFALEILRAKVLGALERGDHAMVAESATKLGNYRRQILNRKSA